MKTKAENGSVAKPAPVDPKDDLKTLPIAEVEDGDGL